MVYQLINSINKNYSPLEQVLINRGIQYEDIYHYLHLTGKDNLSPSLLKNMDKAIQILMNHLLREDNEILLIIDPDSDGYCSSALFLNYLYSILPTSINKIRYVLHNDKQHGIIADAITSQISLVMALDSSSNEFELHKTLYDQSIDIIVLDHHHADQVSPYACVVNNQLDDYPNKTLSGGGVVYKFCQRIDEILGQEKAKDFLDLAAVSLIGDMMDIRNIETRYLIQEGMKCFRNPFLKAMQEKNAFSLKEELTPIGIAFYIVPFINAMTRSGTIEEKELLFKSMLEWEAYNMIPSTKRGCKGQEEQLVEQSIRTCINVKNRQTKKRDQSVQELEQIIADNNLLANKILLIKAENIDLDRNIVGLIANEFMSKYKRPTIILSKAEHEGQKAWEGSARGYEKSKLTDFRQFMKDSELVYLAEGHSNACGCGILDQNINAFISYSNKALKDIDFSPSYKVDFIYSMYDIDLFAILELGKNQHLWGQNIEEPLIAIENIPITKDMIFLMSRDKNPTLKIQLPNNISCIKFKSSEEEYLSLYQETGCVNINLIGRPEINKYFNNITLQLIIKDYEIINYQKYYF